MATKLKDIRINEISLVDRPANKSARVVLAKRAEEPEIWWDISEFEKRDFSAAERRSDAKSGAALPDGSFPIHNASDLHNAMVLAGKAKDPAKAKAHIRSRARALGLTDKLSDSYKRLTESETESGKDIEMLKDIAKALGLAEEASQEDLIKAIGERDKAIADRDYAIAIAKADMDDDEQAYHDALKENGSRESFRGMSKEDRRKAMKKSDDLPEFAKRAFEELEKVKKELGELKEKDEDAKFEKMAAASDVVNLTGSMLRKAYAGDSKTISQLVKMLAEAQAAVAEAGAFDEIGSRGQHVSDNAYDELMVKAEELRKSLPHLTVHQAFEKVYTDPANQKLTAKERAQNRPNAN